MYCFVFYCCNYAGFIIGTCAANPARLLLLLLLLHPLGFAKSTSSIVKFVNYLEFISF